MRLFIFEQYTGDYQVPVMVVVAEDEHSAKIIVESTTLFFLPKKWDEWSMEESVEVTNTEIPRVLYSN